MYCHYIGWCIHWPLNVGRVAALIVARAAKVCMSCYKVSRSKHANVLHKCSYPWYGGVMVEAENLYTIHAKIFVGKLVESHNTYAASFVG